METIYVAGGQATQFVSQKTINNLKEVTMSDRNGIGMLFVGILLGALTGAVVALLFAPQSGAETRTLIKDKSIELRDKAQETAEQARARTNEVVHQLKDQGQSMMQSVRGDGGKLPETEAA
jgi:gas vesicle protein